MNSGIYILYNIFTGRKYIGSSRNLRHRKSSHFSGMRTGSHENYKILREVNQYGVDGFRWEVLETCEIDKLMEREQWWLDNLKPELNIALIADNHSCTETEVRKQSRREQAEKVRGRKQSQEEKDKRAKSIREFWARPENKGKKIVSPEQRAHLSKINMGENNPNWGKHRSPESKAKSRKSLAKFWYVFLSPSGEEVIFDEGLEFGCQKHGIPYGAGRNLYKGITESHNGWKFLRTETHPTSK